MSVTNRAIAGAETATGVVVTDTLPSGVTAQLATGGASQGTFDPATGAWDVGTLAVGQTATLELVLTFSPSATIASLTSPLDSTVVAIGDQPDLYPDDAVNVARLRSSRRFGL